MTWRDRAACIGYDFAFEAADALTGSGNTSKTARREHREAVALAKSICDRCAVRAECLADALATETGDGRERYSIRAGLTGDERFSVKRRAS